ncbi:hypothetical protein COE51_16325 [Bacillus pseudomycoides]|nr:hypothetical protein COE51_16325 [Bacillus pseudomycoides]
MNLTDIYNDPIIIQRRKGTPDDPHVPITETIQVINGKAQLKEVPSRFDRVAVSGNNETWFEVENKSLTNTMYNVDYTNGIVFFNSNNNNKSLTFKYLGTGSLFTPSSRVWTKARDSNVIETLEDVINSVQGQIDKLVVSGDSSPEAAIARVKQDGTSYPTLRDRLNAADNDTIYNYNKIENEMTLKADKNYVDTITQALTSGSPKGTYATVSALQSAFPTGNNNIYIVNADGKWYYWNSYTWTAGGVYQSTSISPEGVKRENIASSAVNYQKLNNPSIVLIHPNKIQVNFKTRFLTIQSDCYTSIEGLVFNISPSSNVEFSLPSTNDSALYLLTFDHLSKTVDYKKYNALSGSDMVIAYIYNKRVYGQNARNIVFVSDNDNFDSLSEQNIKVFNTTIVPDTLDYTRLQLSSATLIKKGFVDIDFRKMKVTIKPKCYAAIQKSVLNLNSNANDIVLDIPTSQSGVVHMLVFDIVTKTTSIIPYSATATDSANKRIILYIYASKVFGSNSSYVTFEGNDENIVYKSPDTLISHLKNPFIKTQIKMIGDSITAGSGGTGYSPTGDFMFVDTWGAERRSNVRSATCWANMLGDLIERLYKKENYISVTNPNLTLYADAIVQQNESTLLDWRLAISNINTNDLLKFNFYGDHFAVVHSAITGGGILEIWVDGQFKAELDTYGATQFSKEFIVSGLSLGEHEVVIKATNRKNQASSGTGVYLEGFKIPKTVIFKNWGISGIGSDYFYNNKASYIENDDNIYIIQVGTNDRFKQVSPEATKSYMRIILDDIFAKGKIAILMSANPVSLADDNKEDKNFKMYQVDNAINELAKEYKMSYISNYQAFFDYEDMTGNSIDTLLKDGLHPNDLGYKVKFNNIVKHLKLPRIRQGI